jgi:hypothetical protein
VQKLYQGLNDKGLYTKSVNDFQSDFFGDTALKKKGRSISDSKNTATESTTPLPTGQPIDRLNQMDFSSNLIPSNSQIAPSPLTAQGQDEFLQNQQEPHLPQVNPSLQPKQSQGLGSSLTNPNGFMDDAHKLINEPTPKQVDPNEGVDRSWGNIGTQYAASASHAVSKSLQGLAGLMRDFKNPMNPAEVKPELYKDGKLTNAGFLTKEGGINSFFRDPLGKMIVDLDGISGVAEEDLHKQQLPDTFFGRGVQGIAQLAPDLVISALIPEGKIASGAGVLAKYGTAFINNPFTKYLIGKTALQSAADADKKGDNSVGIDALKGAGEGGLEAGKIFMLGGLSGKLSESTLKALEGLGYKAGKYTTGLARAATESALWGTDGIIEPLVQGKGFHIKNGESGFFIGGAFGLKAGLEHLKSEYNFSKQVQSEIIGKRSEDAMQNFFIANPEGIKEVYDNKLTGNELSIKALEYADKAIKEQNPENKSQLISAGKVYKKMADVKQSVENIGKNKADWVDMIENNSELSSQQKQQMLNHIDYAENLSKDASKQNKVKLEEQPIADNNSINKQTPLVNPGPPKAEIKLLEEKIKEIDSVLADETIPEEVKQGLLAERNNTVKLLEENNPKPNEQSPIVTPVAEAVPPKPAAEEAVVDTPKVDEVKPEVLKSDGLDNTAPLKNVESTTKAIEGKVNDDVIKSLVNRGDIKYLDEEGKLCAGEGLTTNTKPKNNNWKIIRDIKGDSHKEGGIDVSIKGKQVEAEGKELILRNDDGDIAIIPKKHRDKVKEFIDDNCKECIGFYISKLPSNPDVAEDGGIYDNGYVRNNFFNRVFNRKNIMENQIMNENLALKNVAPLRKFHVDYANEQDAKTLSDLHHNPEYISPQEGLNTENYNGLVIPKGKMLASEDGEDPRFVNVNHPGQYTTMINNQGMQPQDVKDAASFDFVSHSLHADPRYNELSNNLNNLLVAKHGKDMIAGNGGVDAYVRGILSNSEDYKPYRDEMQGIDPKLIDSIKNYVKTGK